MGCHGLLWIVAVDAAGETVEKNRLVPVAENPGGSRVYALGIEKELWQVGRNKWYTTTELI